MTLEGTYDELAVAFKKLVDDYVSDEVSAEDGGSPKPLVRRKDCG